jgi:nucleoid-associated protein YgaU
MLNKNVVLIVLSFFAAGCGLETHTYVMTKDRVGYDQIKNGGCVMGQCPPAPAPAEKTRKIYVLEVTKPVPESEVQKIEQKAVSAIAETTPTPPVSSAAGTPAASASSVGSKSAQPAVVIPVIEDQPAAAPKEVSVPAGTYTVLKDDTLQKISKKVYGSYGKWYKIYEANKAKIKNPNFVKPGTVLNIPAIK